MANGTVKHKVQVEETKSSKWIRLRGVDTKLSAMVPPEALPAGAKPGSVITMTLGK